MKTYDPELYARCHELFKYDNGKLIRKISTNRKHKVGSRAGGVNPSHGYRLVCIDGKHHKEHRIIFFMHHGYMPKYVDHVNRIITDNRIENLRDANEQQNSRNMGKQKGRSSEYIGVSLYKRDGKYVANIQVERKKLIYLGIYVHEKAAALARNFVADAIDPNFFNKTEVVDISPEEMLEFENRKPKMLDIIDKVLTSN